MSDGRIQTVNPGSSSSVGAVDAGQLGAGRQLEPRSEPPVRAPALPLSLCLPPA